MIRFVSTRLTDEFSADAISSGKPALDRLLIESAKNAQAKRTAAVFVWHEPQDAVVWAYFALSAHEIVADDLPQRLKRGMPDKLPAVLLGKLAVHESLHGQGLGGQLLYDVYQRVLAATTSVAARFLVVDALDDDAAAFYEHYGFKRLPGQDGERLVRKLSDIEADVDGGRDATKAM